MQQVTRVADLAQARGRMNLVQQKRRVGSFVVVICFVAGCSSVVAVPAGYDANGFDLPLRADLGEAAVPDEAAVIDDTRRTLLQLVEGKRTQQGINARDVHSKQHGCAKARFVVDADVPKELAHGLFAPDASGKGAAYDAVVRFSTSEPLPGGDDWNPSLKGVGVKVYGVDGKAFAVDDERGTQDFAFNNRPAFPLRSIVDYGDAMKTRRDGPLASGIFAVTHLYAVPPLALEKNLIDSPLKTTFWSQTPIAVGDVVTKMALRPCKLRDNHVPTVRSDAFGKDYLAAHTAAALADGDACFDFLIQPRPAGASNEEFPVEDASVVWNESRAPFIKVARLILPKQDTTPAAWIAHCDELRFTPWHALEAHRPLGSLNRGRKIVYEVLARYRESHVSK